MKEPASEELPRKHSWAIGFALCFLVVIHLSLCVRGIVGFPSVDEVGHLPAGISHWRFARFDLYRVNPPLIRSFCTSIVVDSDQFDWSDYSARPGLRPELDIGLKYLATKRLSVVRSYVLPRIVAVVLSVFGLLVGFYWLNQLFQHSIVPVLFSLFWAFSPAILGNAPTICPDVGSVSLGLLLIYTSWAYSQYTSRSAAIVA